MNAARKLPLRWTAAWLLTLGAAAVSAQTQTPQQIAQKAFASTVLVVTENAEGETAGVGSGFFIRSGLIATNRHVIDEAAVIRVRLVNQDRFHRVDSVAAQDAERDLVLLRVSSLSAPALPLGDSDALQVGETIYAVGNPIGFLEGTFSNGLVSGIRALPDSKLIQMTAPISPGSSGGPVLNAKGEVVGVSTMAIELGQNLNFAIPSNALKKMMERISRPNLIVPTPRPKPVALPERFADYMKWNLPKGAKARLGKGSVEAIAYSPDGKTLAVGGSLGIWLYNAQTGAEINLFTGHMGGVRSLVYSPDGRTLTSTSSRHNTIQIWNAQTGALLRTLKTLDEMTALISSVVAYSPDGRTLAIGSDSMGFLRNNVRTIRIWNAQTGALLRTLKGHVNTVSSMAYSPDGKTIASGSMDNTIRIWNAQTGQHLRTLIGHTRGIISSVVYSPDGKTIASVDGTETIRIWNASTGALLRTLKGGTSYYVKYVAYSPDGKTIATSGLYKSANGDWDFNTTRILNAGTGALLRTLKGYSVVYSPDGQTIASRSGDGAVRIWNAGTGAHLRTLNGGHTSDNFSSVVYSPDGQTIASRSLGGAIRIWNAGTGALLRTLESYSLDVYSMAYSPDGQTIASGGQYGDICIWNAGTGALLRTLKWDAGLAPIINHVSVRSVAYSPDGQTIAGGSEDGVIRIWSARTGAILQTLTGPIGSVASLAYSPDGQTIASASEDGVIRIWNAGTGALLRMLKGHTLKGRISRSVAYSPDGQAIASGVILEGIWIWNAGTGAILQTLTRSSHVYFVAYSPDGQTIAGVGGGYDKAIQIWNAGTGAHLQTLTGHTNDVHSVAYSPDGRTLASGSWDGTILLWDISNL